MIRRSGVEAVNVRQEEERISLDHLRDERRHPIVVAKAQLPSRHSIILVENRNDAEAEQAYERGSGIGVVVPAHHVLRREQNLSRIQVMRVKGRRPPGHEQALAHRGSSLNAGKVLRLGGKPQGIEARSNRSRGDDENLAVPPTPA